MLSFNFVIYKWYWGLNSKTSLVVWNWNSWSCEHILGHPCSRQKISVNSQSTKILLQNILRFAPIVFLATNSSPKPYITICKLTLNSREGRQLKKRKKETLNSIFLSSNPLQLWNLWEENSSPNTRSTPVLLEIIETTKINFAVSNRLVMLDYFMACLEVQRGRRVEESE